MATAEEWVRPTEKISLAPAESLPIAAPANTNDTSENPPSSSHDPADILNGTLALDATDVIAPNNLWQRIRNGYAMPELSSPLIAKHENWYANRPDYVARMTERAQRYLFYILEEVERRGMPSEIALLPMIESAFNPGAYSIGKASGIWQFIPSTGKNFGLQQNWWYDGRRDVISATNSALDYLQKLHDQFGDWQLALAAYNWGEGAVARAQLKNQRLGKPTGYSDLTLPAETQNYVPKLMAIKNIVSDPSRFGLKLFDIPNQPYFAAVVTPNRLDVKLAAELADISMDEFIALNPAHNRPVMLQESAGVLLLPVDKLETFRTNLENTNQPLVSWQTYKTKKGERLDQLAPRFGLSADRLRKVNGLSVRSRVGDGQMLLVPSSGESTENSNFAVFNSQPIVLENSVLPRKYTVHKGDSLLSIARKNHVTLAQLNQWNVGLKRLTVGQQLTIVPQARKAAATTKFAKTGKRAQRKLAHKNHSTPRHLAKNHSAKKKVRVATTR